MRAPHTVSPTLLAYPVSRRLRRAVAAVLAVLLTASAPVDASQSETGLVDESAVAGSGSEVVLDVELAELEARVEALGGDVGVLEARLAALESRITEQQHLISAARADREALLAANAELRSAMIDTLAKMESQRALVAKLAVDAYVMPRAEVDRGPLGAADIGEAASRRVLIGAVGDSRAKALAELAASKQLLAAQQDLAQEMLDRAEQHHQDELEAIARLEVNRKEHEAIESRVETLVYEFTNEVDAMAAGDEQLRLILNAREADFLAHASRQAAYGEACDAAFAPADENGIPLDCVQLLSPLRLDMIWPHPGPVTSTFGPRWGRLHEGLDIGGSYGDAIRSVQSGEVFFAGWLGGYGNMVLVDHGAGVVTMYAHLTSIAVSEGELVATSALLGEMGSTGRSTGPHLHFEIQVDGEPVDPAPFLS